MAGSVSPAGPAGAAVAGRWSRSSSWVRGMLPRFGRFAVVGTGGLVVNNVALLLLHGLWRMALLPATVVAVEIATFSLGCR